MLKDLTRDEDVIVINIFAENNTSNDHDIQIARDKGKDRNNSRRL